MGYDLRPSADLEAAGGSKPYAKFPYWSVPATHLSSPGLILAGRARALKIALEKRSGGKKKTTKAKKVEVESLGAESGR